MINAMNMNATSASVPTLTMCAMSAALWMRLGALMVLLITVICAISHPVANAMTSSMAAKSVCIQLMSCSTNFSVIKSARSVHQIFQTRKTLKLTPSMKSTPSTPSTIRSLAVAVGT